MSQNTEIGSLVVPGQPGPAGFEQLDFAALIRDDLPAVERGVEWFDQQVHDRLASESDVMELLVRAYSSILRGGGKRVRGGLAHASYDMTGGDDPEVAMQAAGIAEGLQATLLVMDDVSDGADTRRGQQTAHMTIEKGLRERGATGPRVGVMAMDMAVNGAFGVQLLTQQLVGRLNVPPERRLAVSELMNERLLKTGNGQLLDIFSTLGIPLSPDEILQIAREKTAYYTFELPIEMGILLATGDDTDFPRVREYAEATGLAFQMWDDVIGVFGDEAKMGKSARSDIVEGKQTLLMYHALAGATDVEREVLRAALRNPDMTDGQFAACKEIIERTGARARVEALAKSYANQAHESLDSPPELWKPSRVAMLHALASFVVSRSS